jgi:hypothetical protein
VKHNVGQLYQLSAFLTGTHIEFDDRELFLTNPVVQNALASMMLCTGFPLKFFSIRGKVGSETRPRYGYQRGTRSGLCPSDRINGRLQG